MRGGTVNIIEAGTGGTDTVIVNGTDAREVGRIDIGPMLLDADASDPDTVGNVFRASTQIRLDDGNSTPATINVSTLVESATVNLKGGVDTLAVRGLNLPLTVDLGDGDDLLLAGSRAFELEGSNEGGTLDFFLARLTVQGGSGRDTLRADDSADTSDNTGTLTATLLTGLDTQGIEYLAFEEFALALGSGNDTLTVTSTVAGPNTITTGAGNDTVRAPHAAAARPRSTPAPATTSCASAALTQTLNGIASTLSITGGGDRDELYLDRLRRHGRQHGPRHGHHGHRARPRRHAHLPRLRGLRAAARLRRRHAVRGLHARGHHARSTSAPAPTAWTWRRSPASRGSRAARARTR